MQRRRLIISGQVQGVGFRPSVYREAVARGLSGYVGNTPDGVIIEVQGTVAALDGLVDALRHNPPPLARIVTLEAVPLPVLADDEGFCIRHSDAGGHGHKVLISPDVATCDDCLRELFDPHDRRYLYPFINCTNCGPRYTLTRSIPYDRGTTSMACFPLCPDCAREYADPADRRFHAQPNACPVCGPKLWTALPGTDSRPPAGPQSDYLSPLRETAAALLAGEIVAIKGLGGFHLACDARNPDAIARLRERKRRPHKALAVMVADAEAVCRLARPRPEELALLTSHARPITLIARRPPEENGLPGLLAPDVDTLGFMLPYTPLHHMLLRLAGQLAPQEAQPAALVMTSGNAGGDPICLGNREALHALRTIADRFLLHDRDILIRADDSVARVLGDGSVQFVRRARGYVPSPLPLPATPGPDAARPDVLAVGADLKNTLCLTRADDAFVSQHIGDLGNPAINAFHGEIVSHLTALLEVSPATVIRDRHPDYHSTRLAEEAASPAGLPVHTLQHHAAHLFAVLGEHRHQGPALGLILDGTGYGDDGTIWGGEVLLTMGSGDVTRVGRLSRFALPGGEAAIREPWRLACGFLARLGLAGQAARLFPAIDPVRLQGVLEVAGRGLGPLTSSCGRLFDAASALLGLCDGITYEGQAAIRLEHAQRHEAEGRLPWTLRDADDGVGPLVELDVDSLIRALILARLAGTPVPDLARQFHRSLLDGLAALCVTVARRTGVATVALGGGVFLNKTVSDELPPALAARGLHVHRSRELPPGDGAVSYGQAVWFVKKSLHAGLDTQQA